MEIDVRRQGGEVIVRPVGKIDSAAAEEFQHHLLGTIHDHAEPVALDFSAVSYISSGGLRVLALAAKSLRERQQRLRLRQPTALVLSVLDLTNFTSFIEVSV